MRPLLRDELRRGANRVVPNSSCFLSQPLLEQGPSLVGWHFEWRDIDRAERVVTVRRTFSGGELRECGKTDRSRRRVPLRQRALDVLDELPRRIDTRLVFPAERGGCLNLHNWRSREWKPAVRAAGIEPERRIYDLHHTYATWALRAGVSLFTLARRMGTSVEIIDRTYGHLAPDAEEYERGLLDAYDSAQDERRASDGHGTT